MSELSDTPTRVVSPVTEPVYNCSKLAGSTITRDISDRNGVLVVRVLVVRA